MATRTAHGPPDVIWLSALFGLTFFCTALAFVLGQGAGIDAIQVYYLYISRIFLLAPVLLIGGASIGVLMLVIGGDQLPMQTFGNYFGKRFERRGSVAAAFAPVLLMPLLLGAFGTLKQLIPIYNPFSWDDTFARIGYHMFFNHSPWRLTHALFGSPFATMALDRLYAAWVPLLFLVTPVVALVAPPLLRARFFLSFGFGFILIGVVGAYYFSSAGPCFAAHLHTETAVRYVELMQRLHTIDQTSYHLSSIYFQDHLWQAYQSNEFGFGNGISAMPSMHNAVAILYALAVGGLGWRLRAVAWTFAGLIMVASVHLGWHYTADGIIAWSSMYCIWWTSGWFLRATGYEQAVSGPATAEPQLSLVVNNGARLAA
ncbi:MULTISPECIES: phosphatase PAP2 family protein [Sphingomonas]|uniref:phosphatase PAP2 family protein n=1 Tax=Sphingomonas TaxID=13687 RepID=UPI0013B4139A|nr:MULTISPECIES: phosphatase PAP2 family protein [Sphingomonas]